MNKWGVLKNIINIRTFFDDGGQREKPEQQETDSKEQTKAASKEETKTAAAKEESKA